MRGLIRCLKMSWLCLLLVVTPTVLAQEQCGTVTSIAFPVDRSQFQIVQDFGVPSPRHQGRYHTGEDYYGGRGTNGGQPVYAIAAGLVTFSSPNGWGRDGGVVIIEHRFPDGSVAYSMYGHMRETDTVRFPARYTCVKPGDVVGAVGDPRPAPHLHFEIRVNQPDVPGAGYTYDFPTALGWRQPSRFVLDWQTWLLPAHRWHLDPNGDNLVAPPLMLSDGSMMVLNNGRLRGLTSDGRVLWRVNLDQQPVALTSMQDVPLLTFSDGTMQVVGGDGALGERWATGVSLEGQPLISGDQLIFHTPTDRLVAFGADRREVVWQLEGVPSLTDAFAAPNVIGLLTENNALWTISPQGQLLDQAQLAEPASMNASTNGNLLVYGRGGLWQVDASGTWSLVVDNAPVGGENSAALYDPAGSRYYFSGSDHSLYAFDLANQPRWQANLAEVTGKAELTLFGNVLLLTTYDGYITAIQESSGLICNRARVYADRRSILWSRLGLDGILRIAAADVVIGLDWKQFIGGCA